MKKQLKEYGPLGIVVYLSFYLTTLTTFYCLIKSKTLDPAKIVNKMSDLGLNKYVDIDNMNKIANSTGATMAFTLILNRLSNIVRLPLTYYVTKYLHKMMRR